MGLLMFGAFPYVALVVFVIGTIYRYKMGFKYSSLSSQFLETKKLYSASVPFHVGIIVVFLGHLIGFLFPSFYLSFGGSSLVALETIGLAFGIIATVGLIMLLVRRLNDIRLSMVTNKMDIVIEIILIIQFILGILIAIGMKWGSGWYASDMVPYLWSILLLNPDIQAVVAMPFLVQLHIFGAFLVILLIPFSRLVHFLVVPLHYITRPYQIVRWYWDKKVIRDTNTPWEESVRRPENN